MQSAKPQITVFIPTYNRLSLLQRAVFSVFECGAPVHLLVLDNCSSDGTGQWLEEISAEAPIPVQITRHSENIGAQANYCAGFELVSTPFLVPLADDDELVPGFLSKAIDLAFQYPDVVAVIGSRAHRKDDKWYPAWDSRRSIGLITPKVNLTEFLQYGHHTTWSAMLWRSKPIQSNDLFNRARKYGIPSDVYFQFSAFIIGPVYAEPLPAASFNYMPGQASSKIGLTTESIRDLGLLADSIIDEVVKNKLISSESEAKKLFSETARRWCNIIMNNRESSLAYGEKLELGPCLAQYFVSLYPYCGMEAFPFISEIAAIASSSRVNYSPCPNVPEHRNVLRKVIKEIIRRCSFINLLYARN
ncbi:glycosyltransferase family 2 protein [Synechococcus sp. CBW1107]|uniref:glycosyltransferase family 2 protein n=1 Tax=Synechococcus sp. CBW1107 TaxID=2789857 RepID=UPI002AD29F0D|nr:glycosyltransferase family 2 protein [Synechococcus sp. CBW1107]CAK6697058.1 hypothetical protein IFHNHDMJ_02150 [Synechococcus sp. CBW1107]